MSDPYRPKIDFIVFIKTNFYYFVFWGEKWLVCFLPGFVRFILTRMSPFRSRPGSMVMQILVWLSPWTLLQTDTQPLTTKTHIKHKHKPTLLNAWLPNFVFAFNRKGHPYWKQHSCSLRAWSYSGRVQWCMGKAHVRSSECVCVCVCDSETPQTQRAACDWTSWRLGYMPGKHEQYRVGKHGVFLTRSQMCRRAA